MLLWTRHLVLLEDRPARYSPTGSRLIAHYGIIRQPADDQRPLGQRCDLIR